MPFRLVSRLDPIPIGYNRNGTDTYTAGQCVRIASGNVVIAAAPTDAVAGVTTHSFPDTSTVFPSGARDVGVNLVDTEQIWEADYVGTPAGGFVSGAVGVRLDATGRNLDATTVSGGPCAILRVDVPRRVALIKFSNRQVCP